MLPTCGSRLRRRRPSCQGRTDLRSDRLPCAQAAGAAPQRRQLLLGADVTGSLFESEAPACASATAVHASTITLPPGQKLAVWISPAVAVFPMVLISPMSPDRAARQQLYFVENSFDATDPWYRRGRIPVLSPDGQWIGFFAEGKLRRFLLAVGRP